MYDGVLNRNQYNQCLICRRNFPGNTLFSFEKWTDIASLLFSCKPSYSDMFDSWKCVNLGIEASTHVLTRILNFRNRPTISTLMHIYITNKSTITSLSNYYLVHFSKENRKHPSPLESKLTKWAGPFWGARHFLNLGV